MGQTKDCNLENLKSLVELMYFYVHVVIYVTTSVSTRKLPRSIIPDRGVVLSASLRALAPLLMSAVAVGKY